MEMASTLLLGALFVTSYLPELALSAPPVASQRSLRPPPSAGMKFMSQFGYLQKSIEGSESQYTQEAIIDAIKSVQRFGSIPETGQWDDRTQKLVESPRCGVPDVIRDSSERRKRNVATSPAWRKRDITYMIANWSPQLGEQTVITELRRAFDVWSVVSRLRFTRVHGSNADIIILFGRGSHGDWYPFDGPGMTLAHAYFPYESGNLGGDIHFDEDEPWQMQTDSSSKSGTDFFTVAVHEIGHSLGLPHSTDHTSIMKPYYNGYDPYFQLAYSDIINMYTMYLTRSLEGDDSHSPDVETTTEVRTQRPTTTTVATTTTRRHHVTYEGDTESVEDHITHDDKHGIPTAPSVVPDACEGNFDAISILRGELFLFKGEYLWRLSRRQQIQQGYPARFRQMFPLPTSVKRIDAVYQRDFDGSIVLFTGNKYWVYDGSNFIKGSPRPITDYGLPGNLQKIDAVQRWSKNKKLYFFSGDKYWRFNETTHKMDPSFPQHISVWNGVPSNLDAAMTWEDGSTYFFKGQSFWRFDNQRIRTADNYPIPTAQYWLNCPEI